MSNSILYSFLRCPYAARARLALIFAEVNAEIREVDLSNKPEAMLQISPKGTVPVLQLSNGRVIDESMDILTWVTTLPSGQHLLLKTDNQQQAVNQLIEVMRPELGRHIFLYMFPHMDPQHTQQFHRDAGIQFIFKLDKLLAESPFLFSDAVGFGDIAIYPFVRNFAALEPEWFEEQSCAHVYRWLSVMGGDERVKQAYIARAPWKKGDTPSYLISV